jgi:hypothetical protein
MAYFKNKIGNGSNSTLNNTGLGGLFSGGSGGITPEFYEMEPAVVLDIILDENHPVLQKHNVNVNSFPDNYKDHTPNTHDKDCTWIGRALVRMVNSQQAMAKDKLNWAIPLDVTGIVEYPLLNETVIVIKYFDNLYYTRRLNFRGFINNSANFKLEKVYGINSGIPIAGPTSLSTNKKWKNSDYIGGLGKYFLYNNKIRRLKKYEGDTSIESRFGQSIRFAAYDDNRFGDKGAYVDYSGDKAINPQDFGGGNPMILIRNRQRKLSTDESQTIHPKLPSIPKISEVEKNVGGIIQEDINHDGSSIHLTSGLTTSKWVTTVYKSMFADGKEEQPVFSPKNSSYFAYPILSGDQIVINTDRIVLSSRFGETLHHSKQRYGIVTDSEYTVDAQDQIVITTNNKTVINSPAIYLGQYGETNEPALLGQTSVDWLYDLCNWLLEHVHWYNHVHEDKDGGGGHDKTGNADKNVTQFSVQQQQLKLLRDNLHKLMSRRVFMTGGGYAPGVNGRSPVGYDGTAKAVEINTATGDGVPGDFKGANRREGPVTKIYN